ncbi:hypothetical protein SADUNF_Sadunf16G0132000 [Salix dunnii]|uniref:Uncharacterized protein n=1 Tax=Salix dunnii TaxID=1413687 RepID=A0A835MLP7_9ROSI|nr:hypothetical protein SADUNF_Sadunf16G0132000 [Salix dunnii]
MVSCSLAQMNAEESTLILGRELKEDLTIKTYELMYVPESLSFLDTATMPVILTVVGAALFAKPLMMEDLKDWSVYECTNADQGQCANKIAPSAHFAWNQIQRHEWEQGLKCSMTMGAFLFILLNKPLELLDISLLSSS